MWCHCHNMSASACWGSIPWGFLSGGQSLCGSRTYWAAWRMRPCWNVCSSRAGDSWRTGTGLGSGKKFHPLSSRCSRLASIMVFSFKSWRLSRISFQQIGPSLFPSPRPHLCLDSQPSSRAWPGRPGHCLVWRGRWSPQEAWWRTEVSCVWNVNN